MSTSTAETLEAMRAPYSNTSRQLRLNGVQADALVALIHDLESRATYRRAIPVGTKAALDAFARTLEVPLTAAAPHSESPPSASNASHSQARHS